MSSPEPQLVLPRASSADEPHRLNYRTAQVSLPPAARRPALGWGLVVAAPLTAVLVWPLFYLVFFVLGFTLALVALAWCLIWAWWVSGRLAGWWYWRRVSAVMRGSGREPSPGFRPFLRALLFALQAVIIILSIPLFGFALDFARQHHIRLGWW